MIKTEKLDFYEEYLGIDAILSEYRILSASPIFGALVFDQDIILTYDNESPALFDTHTFTRHMRCFPIVMGINFFSDIIQEYCIIISRQFFVAKASGIKMVFYDYLQPRSLNNFLKDHYIRFHRELNIYINAARTAVLGDGSEESVEQDGDGNF
jgi:hypothetical protein